VGEVGSGIFTAVISSIIAGLVLLWFEHRSGFFSARERRVTSETDGGSRVISGRTFINSTSIKPIEVVAALFMCFASALSYFYASLLLYDSVYNFNHYANRDGTIYVLGCVFVGLFFYALGLCGVVWSSYRDTIVVSRFVSFMVINCITLVVLFLACTDQMNAFRPYTSHVIFFCVNIILPSIIRFHGMTTRVSRQ
jgi:hypothetical protein